MHHQSKILKIKNAFIFFRVTALCIFCTMPATLFSADLPLDPKELDILRRAYPDILFNCMYDETHKDFRIEVMRKNSRNPQTATLYWADGKMLTLEKRGEKELYWNLMYRYAKDIPDPVTFSQEDLRRLRNFSSAENRSKQRGVSLDFFNIVYDSATRQSTEAHIKSVSFLGKYTKAHEWIFEPLARVENKIRELAKTDSGVKDFIDTLAQVDSYNWREIRDRGSRSFHSYGIAVDVLPRGWGQKNIYWAWRRTIDPDGWMILPLDQRWMPPLKVIQAFESEGFIWGVPVSHQPRRAVVYAIARFIL